ncbi:hypothetical protein SKAU_G00005710, partial [Synaphobranchus kaupii]
MQSPAKSLQSQKAVPQQKQARIAGRRERKTELEQIEVLCWNEVNPLDMETKPFLSLGFLKPQCSLGSPSQRSRSGQVCSSPTACSCFTGMCPIHQRRLSTDASPLSSPTNHRGMDTPSLHPSLLSPDSSSFCHLAPPLNGMGSPFSVISGPMGHHTTPGMGFSHCASPQLRSPMNSVSSSEDIKPPLGMNGVMKIPAQPCGSPLSLTKHICAICGDRSSGKHYGDNKVCLIDKRQKKPLPVLPLPEVPRHGDEARSGAGGEAAGKGPGRCEVDSSCIANEDMPVEKILEAELAVEPKTETPYIESNLGVPSS